MNGVGHLVWWWWWWWCGAKWLLLLLSSPSSSLVVVVGVGARTSTCFLERFRPRWTWRSQYLWLGTTSLEHLHFLPSVLRHLPGSGSITHLPQYPLCSTKQDKQIHICLKRLDARLKKKKNRGLAEQRLTSRCREVLVLKLVVVIVRVCREKAFSDGENEVQRHWSPGQHVFVDQGL